MIDFSRMTMREKEAWMANEAQRLIDARGRIQRPAEPVVWNQHFKPQESGPSAEQLHNDDMARQLAEAMARRDRSNWNGR